MTIYDVNFHDHSIRTTVTADANAVDEWLDDIHRIHRRRLNGGLGLVVGLDVEWQPNTYSNSPRNPVAVLQLCVGHHCLVFQILRAQEIPQSLYEFVQDEDYTFVGVGVENDAKLLYEDYGLDVSRTVDLRHLASERFGNPGLLNAGLTAVGEAVLGLAYNKSRNITTSNWANAYLSTAQVEYACVDAFLSFEIGKSLDAANF